jgi:hypothetical protein
MPEFADLQSITGTTPIENSAEIPHIPHSSEIIHFIRIVLKANKDVKRQK